MRTDSDPNADPARPFVNRGMSSIATSPSSPMELELSPAVAVRLLGTSVATIVSWELSVESTVAATETFT